MTETTDDQPERKPLEPGDYEPHSLRDDLSFLRPDAELVRLVEIANTTPIGFGITLLVGGSVVSGALISVHAFFNETAADVQAADIDALTDKGRPVTEMLADLFRMDEPSDDKDEDGEADRFAPRHIHLRDAVVFVGGDRHKIGRWRGRLVAVDGWSLVQMTAD
jgi:hypothetical protein